MEPSVVENRSGRGSEEDKVKFYTALYHLLIHPNILQDVNGEYPAMESAEILKAEGYNRHTVFALGHLPKCASAAYPGLS